MILPPGAPATTTHFFGRVNCWKPTSTTRSLPVTRPHPPTATILARNTLRSSGAKVPPPRDLGAELAELAEEWTGPSVFVDSSKGSAASPISVASSPSPPGAPVTAPATPSRLRVVPRYSPLASTALTPPRRDAPAPRALHPFFRRPVAPPPRQPRFVATYSSTSESGSQGDSSVFSSQESQDPPSPTRVGTYADEITDEMPVAEKAVVVPRARVRVVSKPKGGVVAFEAAEPAPEPPAEEADEPADDEADEAPADAADAAPTPALPLFSIKSPIPGHFSRTPNIAYTSDASEADDLVSCLRGDVFGFDMEWPLPGVGPTKTKTLKDGTVRAYREGKWDAKARRYTWPQGRTAVVQLCDAHTVIVYRIPENRRPGPGVAAFLADAGKKKVGVNIRNDGNKFARDFPGVARPDGLVELSAIARRIEGAGFWAGPSLVALAKLARRYLARELDKDPRVRSGAWDQVLDAEQLEYAANDVYASLLIHTEMEKETGLAPAKASAFALFAAGDDVPRVAETMGIKETTATWYVAEADVFAGLENVDVAVRRRLMGYITPDSGLALRWAQLLPDLRRSLGEEEIRESV
ncbi:Werner Syndrome-like exonuclease [Vanrija pseudolonga]|uniref:Werner Syndrome-like exonuclease n=1 Tax=Vanrija pseudolonga TaxID=143232 RepID=A0AAF1BLH9_9TREE|nr:Werner Syndrome-like exonuclease [Vanrija pseudolonga]